MKHFSRKTKHLGALLLAAVLMMQIVWLPAGIFSSASNASTALFSSSFEDGDGMDVSGEIADVSGVIKTLYGVKGKGLEVRLETVGGSADYLGSENKYNLFDGKTATKFLTGSSTAVIWFALKTPAAVNKYEIASANDEPTRDPKTWTFYGSNDGSTWTALDSRSNITFGGRFETKSFSFENTTVYEWYKLDVTKNAGAGMVQFSSLDVYAAAGGGSGEQPAKLEVDLTTLDGTEANGASQSLEKMFDGNASTKYLTRNDNCWFIFALTSPAVVKGYKITSANDQPKRDPKDFTLSASNDGEHWTELDSQTGVTFSDRLSAKSFPLASNTTAYLWYKFDVTSNGGTDDFGLDIVQIGEFELLTSLPVTVRESVPSEIDPSSVTGTEGYTGHPVSYAFDGSVSSKYLVMDSQTATVSFKLTEAQVITRYAISTGNDHNERDPKDWKFYGSNNGSSWTLLDMRTGEDFDGAMSTKVFKFTNSTAYLWYKLEVLSPEGPDTWFSAQGNGDVYVVCFSEVAVYTTENWVDPVEEDPEEPDENGEFSVVLSSVKGTSTVSTDEGKEKLFDRDEATKAVFTSKTAWVSYRVNRADTVTAYSVTSANDWANRDPENWTFYGSNDGENWTAFDTQTGVTFASRYEEKIFRLDTPVAYLYYKFDITKNGGNATYTQLSNLTLMTEEEVPEAVPGMTAEKNFGPTQAETGKPGGWTGNSCLAVYGEQSETEGTYARVKVFDGLSIPVSANTTFSYLVFPGLFNMNSYDYEYTSCRVILDLHFTDGSVLSGLGVRDQNGSTLSPSGQVAGECLVTGQWNYVECAIGAAAGSTIDRIDAYFEMASAEDASKFVTFFDDVKIEDKTPPVYEHLSDYITILRGTNNDQAYSRGLCTPAVTLPNGFNFYSPVTNPSKPTASYNYQVNGENNPLDSLTVIHAPSYWLSSYGTWQFMANTSVNTAGGTSGVTSAMISSDARKAKFTHENEIAHAHYYSVTLNEGTAASGVKIEVTPTSHAAYVRFTFPAGAENVNVIFDSLWGAGTLQFTGDGKSFTATTSHNSAGSTKMYICGSFDTSYASASVVGTKQGIVSFPAGTTVVTMKIATSFISLAQAQHSMDLEIGNRDFDGVLAAAQNEWDALCGKFEIEGATYTELVNFYSCLYRMYAYPNLYSENEGTNESPVWVYASPYHNGQKTSGILYTNNGFWDTYRTNWAGYALFTSEKDGEMLDGIVQHYIDSGWIPRWICPGGVNCMVGTSSDIIFADAYLKGIDFNYEKAWESMVKNASAYSSNMTSGGRVNNNLTPFLGYVANSVGEGYAASTAGYVDDYGLYRMALAMGLEDEAEYYLNRCLKYSQLYSEEAGFFMGMSESGVFSATAANYDPAAWGGPKGDYTESVGWVNSFPAVYDGEGLATLYGGREALAAKLNQLFDDSIESMRKVVNITGHEMREFKEVKMGQYEHNNQPAHHLIYTYAFSSEPYRIQQYTREVLRHVYTGSEIGQGLPGDEDNGEMSAWYVFNALGFYPYCLASGEYVIGSPLFDKVTVHLDNGNDIVITAHNNSQENIYIQSATVNGQPYNKLYLTQEMLTSGCEIVYEMGDTPSDFGASDDAKPSSLSARDSLEGFEKDLTDKATVTNSAYTAGTAASKETQVFTDVTNASKLFDGNSLTDTTLSNGAQIVLTGTLPSKVSTLTLTSKTAATAPTGVVIEASNDGESWTQLVSRSDISYLCDRFVQPVLIPEAQRGFYNFYRVTLTGGTTLAEVEFIGVKGVAGQTDDPAAHDPNVTRDLNLDGTVNISDVSTLLNILSGAPALSGVDPDIDRDGSVTISDVRSLLDYLTTYVNRS